jgi:ribonuclease HI
MANTELIVFTDGGCSGNPGPGGWAYVIVNPAASSPVLAKKWGAEPLTTNNRMELSAAVEALRDLRGRPEAPGLTITVFTDSQYVQKGISLWVNSWKRNGWRTSAKEPVKNQDLWQALDALSTELRVRWSWVKGHAGNEYNELCDRMTQEAIASLPKM